MPQPETIQLATRALTRATAEHSAGVLPSNTRNETSLAPVDKGFGAWSFLTAAFFVETLVWGFPNAYGAFLVNYLNDPSLSSQRHASSLLPLIGPLSSGIIYCSGPITYPMVARYPRYRRLSMWIGTLLLFSSLLGASFARQVEVLLALQGVLYAVGGALLYAPCIYYMSEWFVERRGLANGVINAGTATGGLLLPLILPTLLKTYGSSKTLRYLAIVELALICVALPFVKGRLPEARVHGPSSRSANDRRWLKNRSLWFLLLANTLQGLAYFVPVLWLPTYASSLRLNVTDSSLALAMLNGASVIGRLSMGILSDRFSPWLLASATLALTSLSTFVLWGVLSYSLAGVLAYGIAYGCLAGGWSSLWTGFVRPIAKDDPSLSTSIFGIFMLSRGVGNILSTPVSTALQRVQFSQSTVSLTGHALNGYKVAGGQYERMIIYVGTCFAGAAAIVATGWIAEGRRRR